jgi:HlyD family secretion protein
MMKKMIPTCLTVSLMLTLVSCGDDGASPRGSGFIEATEVIVSAEVTGTLKHLYVREGEKVAAGAPLALIDTTTYALRLAEALAQERAAETGKAVAHLQVEKAVLDSSLAGREHTRISRLVDKGSANRQESDQVETRYRQAGLAAGMARSSLKAAEADLARIRANIDIIKKQVADCIPTAPLTGTVVTTYAEPGELAVAGKALVRIAGLDTVWVKIYLPPEDLTRLTLGDQALVDPEDGRSESIKGRLSWISPEAEFTPKNVQTKEARADLVYAVKVTIPNPDEDLKIGMPVMVRMP